MKKILLVLVFATSAILCRADEYFSFAHGNGVIERDVVVYTDQIGLISNVSAPLIYGDVRFSNGYIGALFMTINTNMATGAYLAGRLPDGQSLYITLY